MVHSSVLGFIALGKAFSPPLGSSTYGVNALPHPAGVGQVPLLRPNHGAGVRIRAGLGEVYSLLFSLCGTIECLP